MPNRALEPQPWLSRFLLRRITSRESKLGGVEKGDNIKNKTKPSVRYIEAVRERS